MKAACHLRFFIITVLFLEDFMDNWGGVFDCGVLISLHVSRWGARKMIKLEDLGLGERDDQDRLVKLFKLGSKRLIDPAHLEIFIKIEGKARRLIANHGVTFPVVPTAYFVSDESFIGLKEKLDILQEAYNDALDLFINSYEDYREEWLDQFYEYAKEELSQGQDPEMVANKFVSKLSGFYPKAEDLKERFGFVYTTFTITSPANKIDPNEYIETVKSRREIQRHYQAQVKQQIDGFLEQTVSGLRKELVETCEHVSGLLMDEGKQFNNRSLSAMWNKVEKFRRLNFAGDKRVTDAINELENYITVDAKKYRDSRKFSKEFNDVLSSVGSDLRSTLKTELREIVTSFGHTSKRKLKLKKKKKKERVEV